MLTVCCLNRERVESTSVAVNHEVRTSTSADPRLLRALGPFPLFCPPAPDALCIMNGASRTRLSALSLFEHYDGRMCTHRCQPSAPAKGSCPTGSGGACM